MTLLEFLENSKMDLIDGVDSGMCSQEEVGRIIDHIGELEQMQQDIKNKDLFLDKVMESHKREIKNMINSTCEKCIYVNKINSYTFMCGNKNSLIKDTIINKHFWCILGRVKG